MVALRTIFCPSLQPPLLGEGCEGCRENYHMAAAKDPGLFGPLSVRVQAGLKGQDGIDHALR